MGTMIQRYGLSEEDFHGRPFSDIPHGLAGNNECLNLTRPDIIEDIHRQYIEAGANIIETNTFSANSISQQEYGCSSLAGRMALEGARIARRAADRATAETGRRILVAGSIGPTSKSLSLASDLSDPAYRQYGFDDMAAAYGEQARALIEGGADIIQIETCFDALNVKAALYAISRLDREGIHPHTGGKDSGPSAFRIPVIVSVSTALSEPQASPLSSGMSPTWPDARSSAIQMPACRTKWEAMTRLRLKWRKRSDKWRKRDS